MKVHQFYDEFLAHASYAIESNGEVFLIDPARNPQPYYDFAQQHHAKIVGVIETHPHADFISSHLEISQHTGAKIYQSKLVQPNYEFVPFDDGTTVSFGNVQLEAINTPGHSPDSICVLLKDRSGKIHSVFTGDTLFIGDVGRPDLRELAGSITAKREELAKAMYYSLREKLMVLPEDCKVYPAHGAGTLCGKNLSKDRESTIGRELATNYALQPMTEEKFVELLLEDQPFMPRYFGNAVEINKNGAPSFSSALRAIKELETSAIPETTLIIDTRDRALYAQAHLPNSINLMLGGKFETWLGAIVNPGEKFLIIAETKDQVESILNRIASIGYELQVVGYIVTKLIGSETCDGTEIPNFDQTPEAYTILDVRNHNEINKGLIFENAIPIPLPELRERIGEVPTHKPIVVHCAGGYRSIAGSSIVKTLIPNSTVYDLGPKITEYAAKVLSK